MSRAIRNILLGLIIFVVVVFAVLAIFAVFTVRQSFPKLDGEITLQDLDGPVDVHWDEFGVPHIYASTQHDLFYAQGYVHAQDRFWQMDFWRHIGSGRLSEMFGVDQLETDTFLRTLGWARVAQKELEALDDTNRAIMQAYADGVNAYLADHQGSALSLEYAILKLNNADYQPEPWLPLHTLTWVKAMAWDLGGNMDAEIELAVLLGTLSPEQLAEVAPPYPDDHPLIVPNFGLSASGRESVASIAGDDSFFNGLAPAFVDILLNGLAVEQVLGPRGDSIGSNSWVIAGSRTATGMPLLANDPHLAIQMPSIWYEIGLHCMPKGADCPFEVTGFSFASTPGVVIGHNDRIAWGFTNVGPDVQDLYIERINPDNPNQYEVNGNWVDMELVQETIQVAGGEPVELTVRYTRHGPVISGSYEDLGLLEGTSAVDFPAQYAIALRWSALEPSRTISGILKMDLAQNWDEFRAGASEFDVPSQNLVYADVDGNIGYQTPGRIPIRAGGDGVLPVPGWTDEYEWTGYIPFEELPFALNPPEGYIVTANNAVVGSDYPYPISLQWDHGFRAQRIVDLIEAAPGEIDIAYIQQMQADVKNLNAETLLPVIMQLPLDGDQLVQVRELLRDWDGRQPLDSAPAAFFSVFWKNLLADTFHDDLPEEYWPDTGSRWFEVMRILVPQADSAWWDDKSTTEIEDRDQIFLQVFTKAVDELSGLQGRNPDRWNWGELHGATFVNQSLGKSGIAPIEALFNRGPFPAPGGDSLVNNIVWDALEPYGVVHLPSMRMIVDMSDLSNSLTIHTTGQSGHAYHAHYIDMADLWRTTQYHPMLWTLEQIQAGAQAHLRLVP